MDSPVALDAESQALVHLGHALSRAAYSFVTVTPETHSRVLARAERRQQVEARTLRDVFGWNQPFDRALLPTDVFEHMQLAAAIESAGTLYRSRVRFSTLGDSLYVHSAFPTRAQDAVFFGPDTYRFVALLRRWAPRARRVVDVGCGSGAGGLALAGGRAQRLVLADINPRALAFARVNAALAGVSAEIVQSDVLGAVDGELDLVIANPPYLRDADARAYRHGGGEYGEALSVRIVREVLPRLSPDGVLILYTGAAVVNGVDRFESNVRPVLSADPRVRRIDYEELDPDVFGEELESPDYAAAERIAVVGLRVCVSGA